MVLSTADSSCAPGMAPGAEQGQRVGLPSSNAVHTIVLCLLTVSAAQMAFSFVSEAPDHNRNCQRVGFGLAVEHGMEIAAGSDVPACGATCGQVT